VLFRSEEREERMKREVWVSMRQTPSEVGLIELDHSLLDVEHLRKHIKVFLFSWILSISGSILRFFLFSLSLLK